MVNIEHKDVLELLDAGTCTALMERTLADLELGKGVQYLRGVTPLPSHDLLGFMPAYLGGDFFGAKVITVFHRNQEEGYPSHQGTVLLFDSPHGSLQAMVDGGAVTQVRTGAVSAVATKHLARPDAKRLALLGCGAQAVSHLEAIRLVRELEEVTVWDISGRRADEFAQRMGARTGLPIRPCANVEAAVADADINCTLTPSTTPILEGGWVKPGAHVNAVGACRAQDRELATDLVVRSKLYCDAMESILAEGGDFLIPKEEGAVDDSHIRGSLGQVITGRCPGRESPAEITLFEALGLAIEDIAAAKAAYLAKRGG